MNLENVFGDSVAITKESDIQEKIIQQADALLRNKQEEISKKQLYKLETQKLYFLLVMIRMN